MLLIKIGLELILVLIYLFDHVQAASRKPQIIQDSKGNIAKILTCTEPRNQGGKFGIKQPDGVSTVKSPINHRRQGN